MVLTRGLSAILSVFGKEFRENLRDRRTLISALIFGPMTSIPLLPLLLGLGMVTILFPVAFYRSSRGLWVGFLYLTGDNQEPD